MTSCFRRRGDGAWSRITLGFATPQPPRPARMQAPRPAERIWSIHLICTGSRRVRLPDGGERRLEPGDCVQFHLDHHRAPMLQASPDCLEAVIILDAASWRGCVGEGLLDPTRRLATTDDLRTAVERFRSLLERCEQADTLTYWPLVEALSWTGMVTASSDGRRSPAIAQACALLAADAAGRIPLTAIARQVGLGYEAFRKRFRTETGHGPADWRLDRRMALACSLLAQGERLAAVAERLGYADPFAFSDRFRERTGVRPSTWRRANAMRP